jgi:hypothetical protein
MARGGPLSYLRSPEYGAAQLIGIVVSTGERAYHAYVDDSGDSEDWEQTRFQIIAGAIAPIEKWADLEHAWRPYSDELTRAGLDGLHMIELVQAKQISVLRREQIIDRMYDFIEQIGAFPFGAARMGGYSIGAIPGESPHPYDECVRACARYAGTYASEKLTEGEMLHLFIAHKDGHIERAMNIYAEVRREFVGKWLAPALSASCTPGEVMALQAADLIAYSFGFSLDRWLNSKVNIAAHLAAHAVNRLAAMETWLEHQGIVYKPERMILNRRG